MKKKKILVVGDIMLDVYIEGEVYRISPEAPIPILQKKKERTIPGGAANVANNLVAAGQEVYILSTIGNDENGEILIKELKKMGVNIDYVQKIDKNTTTKTRFLGNNHQQMMRLDEENTSMISDEQSDLLIKKLESNIYEFDFVVISDYLKGLMSDKFTRDIIDLANAIHLPVVVDVKDKNISKYRKATLLKPNLNELCMLTSRKCSSIQEIVEAAEELRTATDVQYVLVTLGGDGMVLVDGKEPFQIPAEQKEVYDVSGAGDTVLAYLSMCLANEYDIREALQIANYAAGIQVGKLGTSVVSLEEINQVYNIFPFNLDKIALNSVQIYEYRRRYAEKKIVFTNGCFDIIHIGHIRYLREASKLGDRLVIGLNSDDSVKRLKGHGRPIISEEDRAELLRALEFVDDVFIFDEDTPYELIKMIKPDVLVKGGDYLPDAVIGKDIVEARGGRIAIIPFVEGRSTTSIINKVKLSD